MISYFGRNFAKQLNKEKSIGFGNKNWALCSSTGYILAFEVCVGKNDSPDQDNYLGVKELVKNIFLKASVLHNKGYKVYFDKYFTSYHSLQYLSNEEICASGTV